MRESGRRTVIFLVILPAVMVLGAVWSKLENTAARYFIVGVVAAPLLFRLLVAFIRGRSNARHVHRCELLSAHDRKAARQKLKRKPPLNA
jgi:hypothetical protein